jgi:hypothetical protein
MKKEALFIVDNSDEENGPQWNGLQYLQQYFACLIHTKSNCTTALLYWWHFQSDVSLTNIA